MDTLATNHSNTDSRTTFQCGLRSCHCRTTGIAPADTAVSTREENCFVFTCPVDCWNLPTGPVRKDQDVSANQHSRQQTSSADGEPSSGSKVTRRAGGARAASLILGAVRAETARFTVGQAVSRGDLTRRAKLRMQDVSAGNTGARSSPGKLLRLWCRSSR